MKNPTAGELAVLRERAERTFSRFPVLPRREDGRMSPESRLRFELTLETILEKNRALGACVVLRRPSGAHETFCFGTARLLGRVPVTEETCFRVASVSKLVMTFGALALVERGVLGLDDDLSACLGYPVRNPRFPDAPVTLRMLLTHTASIRDEGNYGSRGMQKGCTLRELLENAEFEDCVFDHCRWVGTRVQNCRFNACTFDHCNFSGVVFSFTTMKDAWLLNSAFRSMAWGGLQGKSGVFQPFGKIKNCAFRYNDFSGMALNGFDWTGAELQQCTFDDTRLAGASFYGVRLGGTRFTRCDLQKADLRTAEEYAIDLETNKLKGARFSFPDVVRLLDGTGIVIE